jgi:hypothetical protein
MLRRTFANLAMKGGARLEQIQLSLGHASRCIASIQRTCAGLCMTIDYTDQLELECDFKTNSRPNRRYSGQDVIMMMS